MSFLLEELSYQKKAIDAVVGVFDGQQRNFFHNPFQGDVQPNILTLPITDITANKRAIFAANGLTEGEAHLSNHPDICIEMETGTGKTLVYLRTIYELCEAYGFTKFIILVPSVPSGRAFWIPSRPLLPSSIASTAHASTPSNTTARNSPRSNASSAAPTSK